MSDHDVFSPRIPPDATASPRPLDAGALTWAALLGRWVDFARSALALPDDEQGRRLREAVPDIIGLQAVWFALGQLDDLPRDQQALGLDRAEVLIDKHESQLVDRWAGAALPERLTELLQDARDRLAEMQARFR